MTNTTTKTTSSITGSPSDQVGFGTWTILFVLLSLLAATVVVAYLGWKLGSDAEVPATGYVAMALGVIVSLAVGFGLMALIFYSSRKGYDEPPVLLVRGDGNENADRSGQIDDS